MKRLTLTIALLLGIAFGASAQQDGGLFGRGTAFEESTNNNREGGLLGLPTVHGSNEDFDEPLGSGLLLLAGLGAAYLVSKKKKD